VNGDIERAQRWAAAFAERFPDLLEAHLVGSHVTGRAKPDSDYDIILVTSGHGALCLSDFEMTPSDEKAWGWLLPQDAARLAFSSEARCDVMLVDASSEEYRAVESLFFDSDSHALLWRGP
jgi:predicted nucleotidyltransferase